MTFSSLLCHQAKPHTHAALGSAPRCRCWAQRRDPGDRRLPPFLWAGGELAGTVARGCCPPEGKGSPAFPEPDALPVSGRFYYILRPKETLRSVPFPKVNGSESLSCSGLHIQCMSPCVPQKLKLPHSILVFYAAPWGASARSLGNDSLEELETRQKEHCPGASLRSGLPARLVQGGRKYGPRGPAAPAKPAAP